MRGVTIDSSAQIAIGFKIICALCCQPPPFLRLYKLSEAVRRPHTTRSHPGREVLSFSLCSVFAAGEQYFVRWSWESYHAIERPGQSMCAVEFPLSIPRSRALPCLPDRRLAHCLCPRAHCQQLTAQRLRRMDRRNGQRTILDAHRAKIGQHA